MSTKPKAPPKPGRVANLRRLNADPDFAEARDDNARAVIRKHGARMWRKSLIARRGCDVPAHLADQWRELKLMRISNREAARMLKLTWLGEADDTGDLRAALARASELIAEAIGMLEAAKDDEERWVVVDRLQRTRRVCQFHLPQKKKGSINGA